MELAIARKSTVLRGATVMVVTMLSSLPMFAQQTDLTVPNNANSVSPQALQQLQQHMAALEDEVSALKTQVKDLQAAATAQTSDSSSSRAAAHTDTDLNPGGGAHFASGDQQVSRDASLTAEDRGILAYLKGTTINVMFDGYYAYNFNDPIGRVNLLRAYDVSSNAFSLNQADVIFDHPADLDAGRRWGTRLDLQFGQATATLQGNPANEPRPDIYRNVFQAYGTYIVPIGNGLTVDFGKWGSSLGIEGNYTKDQINYSRSYWFNFLPFYHMGIRAGYRVNDKLALNYWVVNGTNQTEPTNGYKDELVGFVLTPNKDVTWTTNYYIGQEHPDAVAASNCGPVPVQPGLCFQAVVPAPNGKINIFDSYLNWQATSKWLFALEGDYVIEREWANAAPGESSAPAHTSGGAMYAKYQFAPKQYLGARAEYLSDRGAYFTGGLFSGVTEALKEVTVTYDYNVADGFLVRTEFRRDWSNQPIFLTSTEHRYSKDQNTATLGVVWWFGRKQGAW